MDNIGNVNQNDPWSNVQVIFLSIMTAAFSLQTNNLQFLSEKSRPPFPGKSFSKDVCFYALSKISKQPGKNFSTKGLDSPWSVLETYMFIILQALSVLCGNLP